MFEELRILRQFCRDCFGQDRPAGEQFQEVEIKTRPEGTKCSTSGRVFFLISGVLSRGCAAGGDFIGTEAVGVASMAGMRYYGDRIKSGWLHEVVEVWHSQIFPRYSVLVSMPGVFLQAAGCREALFRHRGNNCFASGQTRLQGCVFSR